MAVLDMSGFYCCICILTYSEHLVHIPLDFDERGANKLLDIYLGRRVAVLWLPSHSRPLQTARLLSYQVEVVDTSVSPSLDTQNLSECQRFAAWTKTSLYPLQIIPRYLHHFHGISLAHRSSTFPI